MVCYSLFTKKHYKDTHYLSHMLQYLLNSALIVLNNIFLAQTLMPLAMEIQARGIKHYSVGQSFNLRRSSLPKRRLPLSGHRHR